MEPLSGPGGSAVTCRDDLPVLQVCEAILLRRSGLHPALGCSPGGTLPRTAARGEIFKLSLLRVPGRRPARLPSVQNLPRIAMDSESRSDRDSRPPSPTSPGPGCTMTEPLPPGRGRSLASLDSEPAASPAARARFSARNGGKCRGSSLCKATEGLEAASRRGASLPGLRPRCKGAAAPSLPG